MALKHDTPRSAARQGPASDFDASATRPVSVWPHTVSDSLMQASAFQPTQAGVPAAAVPPGASVFDLCHAAVALRALVLVQLGLALVALGGPLTLEQWLPRQAVLAFGGLAATLLWLVLVCALQRSLAVRPPAVRNWVSVGLGAAMALAAWLPLAWVGLADATPARAGTVLLAGAAAAALMTAWLAMRERLWRPVMSDARLAELQARIRPHFLFNALNSAIALVRADPARAEGVLEDLAELFRATLSETQSVVSLAQEIELARRYLDIESVRFGSRLSVQWEVDPAACAARVPPLVLQPLVENAVRHGIEPLPGGGRLRVRVERQRGQVIVTVINPVGDEPGPPGQGMALHNVRERLRLLHDVAAQCDVWREPGQPGKEGGHDCFHARLVLPAP